MEFEPQSKHKAVMHDEVQVTSLTLNVTFMGLRIHSYSRLINYFFKLLKISLHILILKGYSDSFIITRFHKINFYSVNDK